jgi:hypothetical protein
MNAEEWAASWMEPGGPVAHVRLFLDYMRKGRRSSAELMLADGVRLADDFDVSCVGAPGWGISRTPRETADGDAYVAIDADALPGSPWTIRQGPPPIQRVGFTMRQVDDGWQVADVEIIGTGV